MKRLTILVAAALGALVALPASAAFDGAYDVSNWTTTVNGVPAAGGSTINTSGAPASITFLGGDLGCSSGPCTIDFTIAVVGSGSMAFDWDYETFDEEGPGFEDWGYLLNGAFTLLSVGGGAIQSGSQLIATSEGDIFGFRLDCTDCILGPANVTVSNFHGAVPAPATLGLLGVGLMGLAALRRRQAA